jgi:uncharacterized protein
MKPSAALARHRHDIRTLAARRGLQNPRVFGSVLHGTDQDGSDLDLLVDAEPGVTLFDLGAVQDQLEQLMQVPVDIRTPGDLPPAIRQRVVAEAKPV